MEGARLTSRHISSSSSVFLHSLSEGSQDPCIYILHSSSGLWDLCCTFEILLPSLLCDLLDGTTKGETEKDSLKWVLWSNKANLFYLDKSVNFPHVHETFVPNVCVWELWHNAPEFVSSSLTFATQYPTLSLSTVIHAKWSRCSSEIVNAIYVWFLDHFLYWCSLFIF